MSNQVVKKCSIIETKQRQSKICFLNFQRLVSQTIYFKSDAKIWFISWLSLPKAFDKAPKQKKTLGSSNLFDGSNEKSVMYQQQHIDIIPSRQPLSTGLSYFNNCNSHTLQSNENLPTSSVRIFRWWLFFVFSLPVYRHWNG